MGFSDLVLGLWGGFAKKENRGKREWCGVFALCLVTVIYYSPLWSGMSRTINDMSTCETTTN